MLEGQDRKWKLISIEIYAIMNSQYSCQLEDEGGKLYSGTLEDFMLLPAEERARVVQGTLASRCCVTRFSLWDFCLSQLGRSESGTLPDPSTVRLQGTEDCRYCHQVIRKLRNYLYPKYRWLLILWYLSVHSEIYKKVASVILAVYSSHGENRKCSFHSFSSTNAIA